MSSRSHRKLCHIVEHVYGQWSVLNENWTYMRSLGKSKEFTAALSPSHAAHVHNAIQNAFMLDTLRELGALILDRGEDATSLHHTFRLIKSTGVLEDIRDTYRVVTAPRSLNSLEPVLQAEVDAMLMKRQLEANRQEFEKLHKRLNEVEAPVFDTDIAKKIGKSRNKAIAHYDVRRAGEDWKTMTIGDADMNFGDVDAYLPSCAEAVQVETLFVLRMNIDYADFKRGFEKNVNEFIDALVRGKKQQEAEKEERRKAARQWNAGG